MDKSAWNDIVACLWNEINTYNKEYKWDVKIAYQEKLYKIFPYLRSCQVFNDRCGYFVNLRLRRELGPILVGDDRSAAADAAEWIVAEWGGIQRGREKIRDWSGCLGNYRDESVYGFIEVQGTKRISSWSKMLAFANPTKYAIFDSRTSVSINCALKKIGDPRRFHMPQSRNGNIIPVRSQLTGPRGSRLGYWQYLDLLRSVVHNKLEKNLLEAEMRLFANAEKMAERLQSA